jgi:hypothetical protein
VVGVRVRVGRPQPVPDNSFKVFLSLLPSGINELSEHGRYMQVRCSSLHPFLLNQKLTLVASLDP